MPPQLVGGKRAVDFNGNIRKSENKVDEKLKYFSGNGFERGGQDTFQQNIQHCCWLLPKMLMKR